MPASNKQFLFSCIDNSVNGTVNWQKVADECDITSKGAAAIKYKRMKDKFGTASGGNPTTPTDDASPVHNGDEKASKSKPASKKPGTKKRKMEDVDDDGWVKIEAEEEEES